MKLRTSFVAATLLCLSSACSSGEDRRVVALITIDTWRFDHLSQDFTPNLWALSQMGERYEKAYAPVGLTSPSHATMLTGLMPWEHGMRANNHHGFTLSNDVHLVQDDFERWDKAAFVSAWPAGPNGGLGRGWDQFSGPDSGERRGSIAVSQAMEWLNNSGNSFLWVHLYEPHGPLCRRSGKGRQPCSATLGATC